MVHVPTRHRDDGAHPRVAASVQALPAWFLLALSLATLPPTALPAAGQLLGVAEKHCYSLSVTPSTAEAVIGQRIDFHHSVAAGADCEPVSVSWSYDATTPNLLIAPAPFAGVDVAVRAMPGAFAQSRFEVRAEIRHAETGQLISTRTRGIRIDVLDGVRDPDLRMSFDVRLPRLVFEGQPFSLTTTIFNDGDETAPPSTTSLVLEDPFDIALDCPALTVGESCVQTFKPRVDRAGTVRWTACADSGDAIYEKDETNNCQSGLLQVLPAGDADLAVTAILVEPSPTTIGQPTQVTAIVRNMGSVRSYGSTVVLELPGQTVSMDCPEVDAGKTCARTVAWVPQTSGRATLVATVHPDAPEPDTGNNRWTRRVTVEDSRALPDFAITVGDLTLSPAAPRAGEDLTVTVRMRNLGADFISNAPNLAVGLAGPGLPFTRLPCPGILLAGQVCEHAITVRAPSAGTYVFWAEADTYDIVSEPNESDNRRFLNVVVEGADDDVTCQGLWTLTGTGTTTFSTSAPGSVVNDCDVYFAQNRPAGCYRTLGDESLEAVWHKPHNVACPTSVTVTDPRPPFETWTFSVSID